MSATSSTPYETMLSQRIIEENRQQAAHPMTTIVIVDGSGSIGSPTFHGVVKQTVQSLLVFCKADDEVAVFQFSEHVRAETSYNGSPIVPFSQRDLIIEQVNNMRYMGSGTNTNKAMVTAWTVLQPRLEPPHNRIGRIFLLSDGNPNQGADPTLTFKSIAGRANVYAIGIGRDLHLETLRSWTPNSYSFANFESLVQNLAKGQEETTQPYLVSVKVYPSKENMSKMTFKPFSTIYLTVVIRNNSLVDIPQSIFFFEGCAYFQPRHFRIRVKIPENQTVSFEIELEAAGGARSTDYPTEIFWNIKTDPSRPPIVRGAVTIGTQFLACEHLNETWGNCLIFGIMGTGKSSLLNALLTSMTASTYPIKRAPPFKSPVHVTREYKKITYDAYLPIMLTNGKRFPIQFWDTWGLDEKNYREGVNLGLLLGGFVPSGFSMPEASSQTIPTGLTPDENRRIHCVVFVMSAGMRHMVEVVSLLRSQIQVAVAHGYAPLLVVTHLDQEENTDDESLIKLRNDLHDKLGADKSDIYLFQNYTEERVRNTAIDLRSKDLIGAIIRNINNYKTSKQIPNTSLPPIDANDVDGDIDNLAASATPNICNNSNCSENFKKPVTGKFCEDCGQPGSPLVVLFCPNERCELYRQPVTRYCEECATEGRPRSTGVSCQSPLCAEYRKPYPRGKFCGVCRSPRT